MGHNAVDNEAAFVRIDNINTFIFPLVDHLGGVRVSAGDALMLLPGTSVDAATVNFHARYFRGTALHGGQPQGVLELPSNVLNLILDKRPQKAIPACGTLDIFCYHTSFFFLCHDDHWYAALLADMLNSNLLLQGAH